MAPALNIRTLLAATFLWCLCAMCATPLHADEGRFDVLFADMSLDNEVYRLDAGFDLQLSPELHEALHNGVTLTFKIEMEVLRERAYVWDSTMAAVSQNYRVRYIDLSEQYELHNVNSGLRFNLPNFELLIAVLSTLSNFPLMDASLLDESSNYWARIRISVDTESLPTPLRLMAYVTSGWSLKSDWYTWTLSQ